MKRNLYDILGQNIDIPNSFINSISKFEFKQKRKIKTNLFTKIAMAFSFLLVSVNLVTYGLKISDNFKAESAIGYVDNSIQEAVENGYIQNVEMDYLYSKGVGVKIDYVVMSDYNLNILFNFDISKKNIKENTRTYIEDLLIYDENNNIIYCYDYKIYEDFCKKNNVEYSKDKIDKEAITCGRQIIEISYNVNKTLYTFTTEKGFPKSKKIYVNFKTIYFDIQKNNKINGNWNLELNLNEQFYNRKEMNLELATQSDDIELISANITDTTMRIRYKMKNMNNNEISNVSMYIEDDSKNKYYISNTEEFLYVYEKEISVTFPIAIRNDFRYLVLYVSINNEEYIPIMLEQKN